MYELKAILPSIQGLGDRILDELVALYEAHAHDCTVGITNGAILGYVEEDMLAGVTKTILRHLPKVEVNLSLKMRKNW